LGKKLRLIYQKTTQSKRRAKNQVEARKKAKMKKKKSKKEKFTKDVTVHQS
jgi:hypothetical protein